MIDFTITSLKPLLAARKNPRYQENIRAYFYNLIFFLQENGLTTRVIIETNDAVGDDLKIMRTDLTDEGYELMQKALAKWQRSLSAGKVGPKDTTILGNELSKIRRRQQP